MKIQKSLRISWSNAEAMISLELSNLLGSQYHCTATMDDGDYWSVTLTPPITATELAQLLDRVDAPFEMRTESLPQDSAETNCIGMALSSLLLKRYLGQGWETTLFNGDALFLIDPEAPEKLLEPDVLRLGNKHIPINELKSRGELMDFLGENGASHAALMEFCEGYMEKYHDQLCWPYPISDGAHMGTFLALVREGVLSLPYDDVEKEAGELFVLKDARMCSPEELAIFRTDWESFSDELLYSISAMMAYLRREEKAEANHEC